MDNVAVSAGLNLKFESGKTSREIILIGCRGIIDNKNKQHFNTENHI